SYLFFGSANRLYQRVKVLLVERPDCRFVVFDFRLVTGIDSSATHSFSQIKETAAEQGAKLVFVNLTPELERAFNLARLLSPDIVLAPNLDRALETCEETVIEAHRGEGEDGQPLVAWLTEALGNREFAEQLSNHCKRLQLEPGDIVARQ